MLDPPLPPIIYLPKMEDIHTDTPVTEENKHLYVDSMLQFRLVSSISGDVVAFRHGFHAVVSAPNSRMYEEDKKVKATFFYG